MADESARHATSAKSVLAALSIGAVVVAVPVVLKAHPLLAPGGGHSSPGVGTAAAAGRSLPRIVDFGMTSCAPCKVMIGVMSELERQYPDALRAEFVNTAEHPEAMDKYGIRMIPTQIFFSPDGRELFRHVGIMPTDAVVAEWSALGYGLGEARPGRVP